MNPTFILSIAAFWWQRIAYRIQESRRIRRERQELQQMTAHELRDLGISHAALATAMPAKSCCA